MCTRRDSANLFRSETLERIQSASALARGSTDGCQDILGLHAVPKVSLDESSFDLTIAPDNEGSRNGQEPCAVSLKPVSYTHLRAHETVLDLVCRLLLEKKKKQQRIEI